MTTTLRRAALLALALVATGCADSAPTAPASPEPTPSPLLRGLLGLDRHRSLEQEKAREEARVRAAAVVGKTLFATLRPAWNATKPVTNALGAPVLQCPPLPYFADVQIIGPEGGVLRMGPHRFTIPAGALREPTVITGEAEVGLVRTIRFSPHGLKFGRPAKLDLSYAGCRTSSKDRPAVTYVDDRLNVLEWLSSTAIGSDEVRGDVWHFSRFAASRSSYATSW